MKIIKGMMFPLFAVFFSFVLMMIIIAFIGEDPFNAVRILLRGSFGNIRALTKTLENTTPFLFAGLAVALGFRVGLFKK